MASHQALGVFVIGCTLAVGQSTKHVVLTNDHMARSACIVVNIHTSSLRHFHCVNECGSTVFHRFPYVIGCLTLMQV